MALRGTLLQSLRPGYTSGDLAAYLFGSIITVTRGDVMALALLTAVVVIGALLWLRPVMYVAFDREFARSRNIPTRVISYLMAALIAVTIVLSIRIMGIVLLISLITMPVVIVNTPRTVVPDLALAAPVVAVVGNIAGLRQLPPRGPTRRRHNIYTHPGARIGKTPIFVAEKPKPRHEDHS